MDGKGLLVNIIKCSDKSMKNIQSQQRIHKEHQQTSLKRGNTAALFGAEKTCPESAVPAGPGRQ